MVADIFELVKAGDTAGLKALLDSEPAAARRRDAQGVSVLLQALYQRQADAVALLRPAAEPLDIFEAAALGDEARLAALLAESPAAAREWSADGFTALHLAAFFAQPAAVEQLCGAGADVDAVARNPMQVRPLNSAAASGCLACVLSLLQYGAQPDGRQAGGWTALHSAAKHGNHEKARQS